MWVNKSVRLCSFDCEPARVFNYMTYSYSFVIPNYLILQNVYNICKGFSIQSVIIFYSYIYLYAGNLKDYRIRPLSLPLSHKKARKKSGRVGLS